MKGCLIAFAVVLVIILVLVAAAAIYLFGFEKELPQSAIDLIKENLEGISEVSITRDFNTVNECSDIEGEYHLTQEGSTSKHILKRLGKDATLTLTYQKYEGDTKIDDLYFYQADGKYYYKENGGEAIEETQSVWQAAVKEYFFMCMPLEEKGDKAVLLGGSAFENNLETVKQKGFNVTAIAKEGSDVYSMTYNVQTSLLSDYTVTFADGTIKKYIVELNIDDFKG